jgi:hypothetical protein
VRARVGAPQRQDQFGTAIDHRRLAREPRRRVHHPEYAQPVRHAIQVTQFARQAAQHRQQRQPRGHPPLLQRQFAADLAERSRDGAVVRLRAVPRNQRTVAHHAHEAERQHHPGRHLHRGWQGQSEFSQAVMDG